MKNQKNHLFSLTTFIIFCCSIITLGIIIILGPSCIQDYIPEKLYLKVKNCPDTIICGQETLELKVEYQIPQTLADHNFELFFKALGQKDSINLQSFVCELSNLSYYKDPRDTIIKWWGTCIQDNYIITSCFGELQGKSIYTQNYTEQKWDKALVVLSNNKNKLLKWCGDFRYGYPGETLGYRTTYPIGVKLINDSTQEGVNGETIAFQIERGGLTNFQDVTAKKGLPYSNDAIDGLALTSICLPGYSYPNMTLKANWKGTFVEFTYFSVMDTEIAFDSLKIHECYYGDTTRKQIKGDGFWDEEDKDSTKKELKIEVDWDFLHVNYNTIYNAMLLVEDLFSKVDINVFYDIEQSIDTDPYDRQKEKSDLFSKRWGGHKGIGRGYVHLIVGEEFQGNESLAGHAVNYGDPEFENVCPTICANYGSNNLTTGSYPNNSILDSVGCVVFAERLFLDLNQNTWYDSAHVLAVFISHEIGHAIGLGHQNNYIDYGIMSIPIDIKNRNYEFYAYFHKPTADAYLYGWLINLRKVLGRETVDCNW